MFNARAINMLQSIDLYLGLFLIVSGLIIGLINVRRVFFKQNKFSKVLLSENIVLSSIGIAFVLRAAYSNNTESVLINNIDMNRMATRVEEGYRIKCGFLSLLISYGPLIISMTNSFLSLIINNYMHYQMIIDSEGNEENIEEVDNPRNGTKNMIYQTVYTYIKTHKNLLTIITQWTVPLIIVLLMFPIQVKEVSMSEARHLDNMCMTMFDMNHVKCLEKLNINITSFLTPIKFYEGYKTKNSAELNTVLENVMSIIKNHSSNTDFSYTPIDSSRQPKLIDPCYKLCITDNRMMIIYMFVLASISYFVPIIISTVILTRISNMKLNKPHIKSNMTREFLYNVVFWSPVMFDTFVSLILCSYSSSSVKTSFFNAIANIYQAVRNILNTKYLKENTVVPV